MVRILFLILLISQLNSFTQTLIPYRIGDKWGYCNLEKKIIIKPQFEDVNPFNFYNDNGVLSNISYAIVKMNGNMESSIHLVISSLNLNTVK